MKYILPLCHNKMHSKKMWLGNKLSKGLGEKKSVLNSKLDLLPVCMRLEH